MVNLLFISLSTVSLTKRKIDVVQKLSCLRCTKIKRRKRRSMKKSDWRIRNSKV